MAILLELAQYLEDQTALKKGTTLFNGLPASPDSCVSIQLLAGGVSIRAFRSGAGVVVERPMVMLMSRSTTKDAALSALLLVQSALDGLGNTTMSGVNYLYVEAMHAPAERPPDESKRRSWFQKYAFTKEAA